ncbi:winged helix-turn-helix transcriptional regulator [Serratia proteamaculans]|uniref:Helix-turn-helix transcriptional regulator n=1 Tax=Serratia proteamaculans TaxID=28151 RepID=A0A7U0N848_SERPR|nr:helix-turn-helix domain-containing protein [Serratia proteamaculans]MBO1501251.1 helix-turn-helix transcriptional regulator [Serratia proteamaculans]MDW5509688.1 helix-turn-helix domain-containing protein [Serratia proteamaculans]QQX54266.1 helix-turn-helix transcriptional regulator [Serratia proteamaculans]WEO90806.1 helix-turn-helix domain-containing protein [Serratia proteamaculans]
MSIANKKASCPVEITLKVIGGKWKVLIIHFLLEGTKRFGELTRCLGPISPKILAQQLRELEDDGLVVRKDFGEIPPRVEYAMSSLGNTLSPILYAMADWGDFFEARQETEKPEMDI